MTLALGTIGTCEHEEAVSGPPKARGAPFTVTVGLPIAEFPSAIGITAGGSSIWNNCNQDCSGRSAWIFCQSDWLPTGCGSSLAGHRLVGVSVPVAEPIIFRIIEKTTAIPAVMTFVSHHLKLICVGGVGTAGGGSGMWKL